MGLSREVNSTRCVVPTYGFVTWTLSDPVLVVDGDLKAKVPRRKQPVAIKRFRPVLKRGDRRVRNIRLTETELRHLSAFLETLTVPVGAFPGQSEPIVSVGSWSFVLARPALPEDIAYKLARAIHKAESALARRLPQAAETTAANTLAAAPSRHLIHPGVLRYLSEIGLGDPSPSSE